MAKKFIGRHLEFYGFPDQNVYASENGVDLSQVHKKNEEQDKEIDDLERGKANWKELEMLKHAFIEFRHHQKIFNEKTVDINCTQNKNIQILKRTVEDLLDNSDEFSEEIDVISGDVIDNTEKIEELSGKVEAFSAETVQKFENIESGITTDISVFSAETIERLDTIENDIDLINNNINDINNVIDAFSAETITSISRVENKLIEYSGYAANEFAHQDNIYTKAETEDLIDDKVAASIDGLASEEWVTENFITLVQGDERYTNKATYESFVEDTNDAIEGLDNKFTNQIDEIDRNINDWGDKLDDLSARTDGRFAMVNSDIHELNDKVDTGINNLKNRVIILEDDDVSAKSRLADIESTLGQKADKTELTTIKNNLQDQISQNARDIATKVDKNDYNAYTAITNSTLNTVQGNIQALFSDKASKTELEEKVNIEKVRAERAEQDLGNEIEANDAANNARMDSIESKDAEQDGKIAALSAAIITEKVDRADGDAALLGVVSDPTTAATIWGVKNYATSVGIEAQQVANQMDAATLGVANTYTDNKVANIRELISGKADNSDLTHEITRAQNAEADLRNELSNDINDKIATEKVQRQEKDTELTNMYNQLTDYSSTLSNRVNAITSWNGTNPSQYVDTGNGVLDKTHREIEQLIQYLKDNHPEILPPDWNPS